MTRNQTRSAMIVCQRCGRGFLLTDTYLDLLERHNAREIVPVSCPTCFLGKGPLPKDRGEIKWFNARKHYGFITTEGGEEVFFHQKQVVEENGVRLQEGQAVRFHLHYPLKGPEALNVELLRD